MKPITKLYMLLIIIFSFIFDIFISHIPKVTAEDNEWLSGSINLSKSPPYYNNQQIIETSLQHALVYICSYYMENNHQNS